MSSDKRIEISLNLEPLESGLKHLSSIMNKASEDTVTRFSDAFDGLREATDRLYQAQKAQLAKTSTKIKEDVDVIKMAFKQLDNIGTFKGQLHAAKLLKEEYDRVNESLVNIDKNAKNVGAAKAFKAGKNYRQTKEELDALNDELNEYIRLGTRLVEMETLDTNRKKAMSAGTEHYYKTIRKLRTEEEAVAEDYRLADMEARAYHKTLADNAVKKAEKETWDLYEALERANAAFNNVHLAALKMNKDFDDNTANIAAKNMRKQEEAIAGIENSYRKAHTAAILYNKEFDAAKANKAEKALLRQEEVLQEIEKKAWEASHAIKNLYNNTKAGINKSANIDISGMGKTEMNAYNSTVKTLEKNLLKLKNAGNITEKEFKELASRIDISKEKLAQFGSRTKSVKGDVKEFSGLLDQWWQKFGRVAIGFTLAYRAMNAFEEGFRNTVELVKEAIIDSGELAALQGELATYYMLSGGSIDKFGEYIVRAGVNVEALRKASLHSLATIEELTVAYSELAQHGVFIQPEEMDRFSAINDGLIQIAKSTGDNAKQIRSEWQGLLDGQMKATNSFVRFLKTSGIISAEQVKQLKALGNKGEIVRGILEAAGDEFIKMQEKLLKSKPQEAFTKWRDSLKSGILLAIQDVGNDKGLQGTNIFAEILVQHIEKLNNLFADTSSRNAFKDGIDAIATGLDKTLTIMEGFIINTVKFTSWVSQNSEQLLRWGKILGAIILYKEVATVLVGIGNKVRFLTTGLADSEKTIRSIMTGYIGIAGLGAVIVASLGSAYASAKLLFNTESTALKLDQAKKQVAGYDAAIKEHINTINKLEAAFDPEDEFTDKNLKLAAEIMKQWDELNKLSPSAAKNLENIKKLEKELHDLVNTDPKQNAIDGITKPLKASWNAIKTIFDKMLPDLKLSFTKFEDIVSNALGDATQELDECASALETFKNAISSNTDFYDEFVNAIKDGNKELANSLSVIATEELYIQIEEAETRFNSLVDAMKEASRGDNFTPEIDLRKMELVLAQAWDDIEDLKEKLKTIIDPDLLGDKAKKVKSIWQNTMDIMQNSISDTLSDGMKGEFDSIEAYAKAFTDSMIDMWAAMVSEMALKDIMAIGAETGSTAATAAATGGLASMNPWMMGAGIALTGASMLLGDDEPSFGEQMGNAIYDLIDTLEETIRTLDQQITGMSELQIVFDNMSNDLMNKEIFDGRTLAGNFSLPSIEKFDDIMAKGYSSTENIPIGYKDKAWTLDPGDDTTAAIESFYNSLTENVDGSFNMQGAFDFYKIITDSLDGGRALLDSMRVALGFGEASEKTWENIVRDLTTNSQEEQTTNTASGMKAIMDVVFKEAQVIGKGIVDSLSGYQDSFDTERMTTYEQSLKSLDETFGESARAGAEMVPMLRSMLTLEGLSEDEKTEIESQIEIFRSGLKDAADAFRIVGEEFRAERDKIINDMAQDIAIADGSMSGMEQAYLSIRKTADDYTDALFNEGMALAEATTAGDEYYETLKGIALETQLTADRNTLLIQKYNLLGESEKALAMSRQLEIDAINKLYGAGSDAANEMIDLASTVWDLGDAAENAASAVNLLTAMYNDTKSITAAKNLAMEQLGFVPTMEQADYAQSVWESADKDAYEKLAHDLDITTDALTNLRNIANEIYHPAVESINNFSSTVDNATESLSDILTEANAWKADYLNPLEGLDAEFASIIDTMGGFRDRMEEVGEIIKGWEVGGTVEKELGQAAAIEYANAIGASALADIFELTATDQEKEIARHQAIIDSLDYSDLIGLRTDEVKQAFWDAVDAENTLHEIKMSNIDEELNALEDFSSAIKSIDDFIWDLQGGSLSGVQSIGGMQAQYDKLYSEAMAGNDPSEFISFASGEYADFMQSLGTGWDDIRLAMVADLEELKAPLTELQAQYELANATDANTTAVEQLTTVMTDVAAIMGMNSPSDLTSSQWETWNATGMAADDYARDTALPAMPEYFRSQSSLPAYASGGSFIAGENGAEIININSGSSASIANNADTTRIISEAVAKAIAENNGGEITLNLKIETDDKGIKVKVLDTLVSKEGKYRIKAVVNG